MEDEAAIVEGLRRGDVTAFDRTYALHHRRLFSFLLRLSGRRDTAEDLVQETWLRLTRAAPSLAGDTRLAPLLFTIGRNLFVSHRRWAMLDLSRLVTFGLEALVESQESPDVTHDRAREIALLERGLAALPVASREVLLLVGVEGLGQEEVATILGISYDSLRQRLARARGLLATKMAHLERGKEPRFLERKAREER